MPTRIPADVSPFTLLYYLLRLAGFMFSDGKPWSMIYSFIHLFMISSMGILAVLEVIFGNEDLNKTVLAMTFCVISLQLMVKLVVMTTNEFRVRELLNRLDKYRLKLLADDQYRSDMIEADKLCRRRSRNYFIFVISYPFISVISNVVTDCLTNFEEPHLTLQVWIPWEVNGFWSYTTASLYELLMSISGSLIYTTCGSFQFTLAFQISAYIQNLQKRLINNGPSDKSIYQDHKIINQFLLDYIDIYSVNLLVEIMVASFMPCGFGYAIIKDFKNNKPQKLDNYHLLILCCFGPFIMYNCGQEISTQMEKLHQSTYMSKWYEENPKVRRDLFTMKLITVRPVTLHYRLFIPIDMKCGTTVAQGIYTYLMMINHFETAD